MRLLSFDTSTSDLHACLANNQETIVETVLQSNAADRQYAASHLIPTIQRLLDEVGWAKSKIEAVVVGTGPGSFTGTRVALVTARTIAQALALPLIDVSIFESYAFAAEVEGRLPAALILSAARQHFFWSAYEVNPYQCLFQPSYTDLEAMTSALKHVPVWLVDTKSYEFLSRSELSRLDKLPLLENIAVIQCQVAWHKLCLLGANLVDSENPNSKRKLLTCFPYERVVPLYLQNASITLKSKV